MALLADEIVVCAVKTCVRVVLAAKAEPDRVRVTRAAAAMMRVNMVSSFWVMEAKPFAPDDATVDSPNADFCDGDHAPSPASLSRLPMGEARGLKKCRISRRLMPLARADAGCKLCRFICAQRPRSCCICLT